MTHGFRGSFALVVLVCAALVFLPGCSWGKYSVDADARVWISEWPLVVRDGSELKQYEAYWVSYIEWGIKTGSISVATVLSDEEWARRLMRKWPRTVRDLARLGSPSELLADIPWYRRVSIAPYAIKTDDIDPDQTLMTVLSILRDELGTDERVWIVSVRDPLAIAVEASASEEMMPDAYWQYVGNGHVYLADEMLSNEVKVSEVIWTWNDLRLYVGEVLASREKIDPEVTRWPLESPATLSTILATPPWLDQD